MSTWTSFERRRAAYARRRERHREAGRSDAGLAVGERVRLPKRLRREYGAEALVAAIDNGAANNLILRCASGRWLVTGDDIVGVRNRLLTKATGGTVSTTDCYQRLT